MQEILQGTVHTAGEDLEAALRADPDIFRLWQNLTPLGRNEFICWVDDAKQIATRQRRIRRTCEELVEGKKRPCCWAGCIHRTDKAPSRWQQAVLVDRKPKPSRGRRRKIRGSALLGVLLARQGVQPVGMARSLFGLAPFVEHHRRDALELSILLVGTDVGGKFHPVAVRVEEVD
jgi:hypothetical protein